jgi:hypothetical protein
MTAGLPGTKMKCSLTGFPCFLKNTFFLHYKTEFGTQLTTVEEPG